MSDYVINFSSAYKDVQWVYPTQGRTPQIENLKILLEGSQLDKIYKSDISGGSFDLRTCPMNPKKKSPVSGSPSTPTCLEPVIPFGKAVPVVGGSKMEVHLGLGRAILGAGAGKIRLYPENFEGNSLVTTDAVLSTLGDFVEITSNGTRRQALALEGLADIQVLAGGGFAIKFYTTTQVGSKTNGIYATSGSPFVTYEITDPGSSTDDTVGPYYTYYGEFEIKRIAGTKTDYLVLEQTRTEDHSDPNDIERTRSQTLDRWHKTLGSPEVVYERDEEWIESNGYRTATLLTKNGSGTTVHHQDFKFAGTTELHCSGNPTASEDVFI